MYQAHEDDGYALRPSATMTYRYPDRGPIRTLTVRSNAAGFRDSWELDEQDERRRVIVAGDSFVFGEGVEENERMTGVLEENFGAGWRVDNFGIPGWGPDLMLRALETAGRGIPAKALLLCLYTHDFRRVHPLYAGIGFPLRRYVLRDGELAEVPYPAPSLWQKFWLLWAVSPLRRSFLDGMWDVHTAILDRFAARAEAGKIRLGLVFLPGKRDTEEDRERREWLRSYATARKLAYLDLTDRLHARPRGETFIHGNPHWNPDGHRLAGEALAEFLGGVVTGAVR
jgi:hypothetical protein